MHLLMNKLRLCIPLQSTEKMTELLGYARNTDEKLSEVKEQNDALSEDNLSILAK